MSWNLQRDLKLLGGEALSRAEIDALAPAWSMNAADLVTTIGWEFHDNGFTRVLAM